MRKATFGLASILVPALAGGLAVSACGEDGSNPLTEGAEAACGPCGVVAQGDVGVSGNAKLDGFFQAVSTLSSASVSIQGSFEADIDSLLLTFGVEGMADAAIGAKVDALIAEINAELTANVDGGLVVNYAPPRCSASLSVAVEAQAKCEVKGGCEVDVDPGNISVECSGTCEGSCEGTCEGGFRCDVSASGVCEGQCEGTCELMAAAACNGTCRGDCSGSCSAYAEGANGMAECAGQCDGTCEGSCELNVAAECNGSCRGSCKVEVAADCEGTPPTCSGECTGQCSGGCTGEATPPRASAECDASADCQAQAKAQASASLECTPPSLDIGFEFAANVDAAAEATFVAKFAELKLRGASILQGFARYEALISGRVNGEVVFTPSPLNGVIAAVGALDVDGEIFADIPVFRLGCAGTALVESASLLGTLSADAAATLQAQGRFAAVLIGG